MRDLSPHPAPGVLPIAPASGRWVGIAREVPRADPISLTDHPELTCFWDSRDDEEAGFVGLGIAGTIDGAGELVAAIDSATGAALEWWSDPPDVPGPWFGGLAFDPTATRSAAWAGFPATRWVLPRVAVGGRKGRTWVMAFAPADSGISRADLEAQLDLALPPVAPRRPTQAWRLSDDRASWDVLVGRALESFASGALLKVVAARSIQLELMERVDRQYVLGTLRKRFPSCSTFLLRGTDGSIFLGATPETLVRRRGRSLATVAMAGSIAAGAGPEAVTEKERREHEAVRDGIRRSLTPFAASVEVDPEPSLMPLRNIVHLRSRVRAQLRSEADFGAVARALHPTAALGGTPTGAALAFLRTHEGLDRGWYGGAVGWLSPTEAHLVVAIRSALITGDRAQVFAGAGLVAGSDVDLEWEETRQKASAMLGALGGLP